MVGIYTIGGGEIIYGVLKCRFFTFKWWKWSFKGSHNNRGSFGNICYILYVCIREHRVYCKEMGHSIDHNVKFFLCAADNGMGT